MITDRDSGAERTRRRRSAALAAIVLACAASGFGCGGSSEAVTPAAATPSADPAAEKTPDAIVVEVGPVSRSEISALYTTSATLRADRQATVTSRTAGVVRELRAEEGDWVEADDILAVLDDGEQRIEYEKAAFTAEIKEREAERAASLHKQGLTSDEAFGTSRREAGEARQVAEMAQLLLERTRVRASFAGRITRRHLDAGNTVTNGTPFYDIADLDPLYADVNVPERQVARLREGQQVRLAVDAGEAMARARIERIAPVVDPATGTVKVTLAVPAVGDLRPGGFVRVEIVTDTHRDALVVPRSALVAEGRRWHLFRLGGGGATVERVEVMRGFEEGDRVEVLPVEGGPPLSDRDRVVVAGASALTDGAPVKTQPDEANEAQSRADTGEDRVAA